MAKIGSCHKEKDCFCQYFLKLTFAETKWKFWIVYTKSYLWNIREPFLANLGVQVKDNLQRFLLYFVVAIYYVTLSDIIHKYSSRRQPILFFCSVLFTAAQPYCWLCSNYDIFWHDFGISMITNVKLDILPLANIKYELLFHRISFIIVETFFWYSSNCWE